MSGLKPGKLALWRTAPLIAVLVALGPAGARAASPAPDPVPGGTALAPDPVPAPRPPASRPAARHSTPAPPPRRLVAVVVPRRTVVREPAVQAPKPVRHRRKPTTHAAVAAVVDVVPLRVDVHRGLGSIASQVRDDRRLALAGAALLAAVLAAASGAGLAFVARRPA